MQTVHYGSTLCQGSTVSIRVFLGIERNQLECIAVFFIASSLDLVGAYRTTMGSFDLRRNRRANASQRLASVVRNMKDVIGKIHYPICNVLSAMVFYHTGDDKTISKCWKLVFLETIWNHSWSSKSCFTLGLGGLWNIVYLLKEL